MPKGSQAEPDDFSKALTTVVRLRMAVTGTNISALAEIAGIPRPTLSRLINDQRLPDLAQARMIAKAIDIPFITLMTYADNVLNGAEPPIQELYRGHAATGTEDKK